MRSRPFESIHVYFAPKGGMGIVCDSDFSIFRKKLNAESEIQTPPEAFKIMKEASNMPNYRVKERQHTYFKDFKKFAKTLNLTSLIDNQGDRIRIGSIQELRFRRFSPNIVEFKYTIFAKEDWRSVTLKGNSQQFNSHRRFPEFSRNFTFLCAVR